MVLCGWEGVWDLFSSSRSLDQGDPHSKNHTPEVSSISGPDGDQEILDFDPDAESGCYVRGFRDQTSTFFMLLEQKQFCRGQTVVDGRETHRFFFKKSWTQGFPSLASQNLPSFKWAWASLLDGDKQVASYSCCSEPANQQTFEEIHLGPPSLPVPNSLPSACKPTSKLSWELLDPAGPEDPPTEMWAKLTHH